MSRPGVPLFALLLVTAGVILLLQNLGVLPWELWANLWRFWPVLLIIAGISVILGPRYPLLATALAIVLLGGSIAAAAWYTGPAEGETVTTVEHPLDGVRRLELDLDFGAGSLVLASLPEGSPLLVQGEATGGTRVRERFTREGDTARLKLDPGGISWIRPNQRWSLQVARGVEVVLDVNSGASDIEADLSALNVSRLDLDVGASDTALVLSGVAAQSTVRINAGAADVEVTVPQGVAARIETKVAVSSVTVDQQRFPRSGNVYQSPDYATAPRRVEITISGGAADVTVK